MQNRQDKLTTFIIYFLIILGTLLLSVTTIKSGLVYDFGLGFWGPNGHDAIWHLSIINQLTKNIPPLNPVFSGNYLSNYHWGFDLFVAFFLRVTKIDILDVYFRFFPIFTSLCLGFLSYQFAYIITKNKTVSLFFIFLNYFCGSFGWLITLIRNHSIGGESLFWSMQSASTLLNPPYALSLPILLLGLLLWHKKSASNKLSWAIITGLVFTTLAAIKVYAGILIGLALALLCLKELIYEKKISKFNFIVTLTTGITSLLILYLFGALKDTSLLIFKPLWFSHSLIESYDKLYLPRLATFRTNLSQQIFSYKLPFLLIIEASLLLIFIIGNLGTRLFFFFPLLTKIKNHKLLPIDKLLLNFLFFSLIIPLFFVQKGTSWNTIQFFYYFIFISNFYFAIYLSKQKNILWLFLLLIITPLTSFSTLKDYFGYPPPASLPISEIKALKFLKDQPGNIILTYPYDPFKKDGLKTPISLSFYETTAYVSAFSTKTTFLEDEMNLEIIGSDWRKRRKETDSFFASDNKFSARGFLLNNNIDYIYLLKEQQLPFDSNILQIDEIYNTDQIKIYKVRK